jgi:hypothetical protein
VETYYTPRSLKKLCEASLVSQYGSVFNMLREIERRNMPEHIRDAIFSNVETELLNNQIIEVINYMCPPERRPNLFCQSVRRFVCNTLVTQFLRYSEEDDCIHIKTLLDESGVYTIFNAETLLEFMMNQLCRLYSECTSENFSSGPCPLAESFIRFAASHDYFSSWQRELCRKDITRYPVFPLQKK